MLKQFQKFTDAVGKGLLPKYLVGEKVRLNAEDGKIYNVIEIVLSSERTCYLIASVDAPASVEECYEDDMVAILE